MMCAIKTPSNDIFGDVVAHDIEILFQGYRFDSRPFGSIKLDYLVNGDSKSKHYYCPKYDATCRLSISKFKVDK